MILISALISLLALYLCIQSAWSLNNFIRLKKAKKDNARFADQCNIGGSYVDTGYALAIVSLVGSAIVLLISGGFYIHALVVNSGRTTTVKISNTRRELEAF